jgi:hypothetical protein
MDELSQEVLVQKDHLMSYLENYGPLAVLVFLRSQAEVQESNKEQKKRRDN